MSTSTPDADGAARRDRQLALLASATTVAAVLGDAEAERLAAAAHAVLRAGADPLGTGTAAALAALDAAFGARGWTRVAHGWAPA